MSANNEFVKGTAGKLRCLGLLQGRVSEKNSWRKPGFREYPTPEARLRERVSALPAAPRRPPCWSWSGSGVTPSRKYVKRVLRFRARLNGEGLPEVEVATIG